MTRNEAFNLIERGMALEGRLDDKMKATIARAKEILPMAFVEINVQYWKEKYPPL